MQILKYVGAITAVPSHRLTNIIKKLRNIDDRYTLDIKERLLEKDISNQEKLELIKLKIRYVLKNLKRKRKIIYITFVIALLIFLLRNETQHSRTLL